MFYLRIKKLVTLHPVLILVLLSLLACGAFFFADQSSSVSLGDEVHHYRFAKDSFALGGRALHDLLYESPEPPGFYYASEIAWPLGLAKIWSLLGGPSEDVARFYHSVYFLLLILGTFFIGKHLYGKKTGFLSALFVMGTPMITTFGFLYYIDLPAAALVTLSILLTLKRKYFLLGIFLGIQYLTKRNVGFFMPAIVVMLIIQEIPKWRKLLWTLFYVFGLALAVVTPDVLWRRKFLLGGGEGPSFAYALQGTGAEALERIKTIGTLFMPKMGEYTNSSILNPKDCVMYFGVALLLGLVVYIFKSHKEKKDILLWMLIGSYVFFALMMKLFPDIRYFLPVVPFLCILSAKGFASLKAARHVVLSFVVFVCVSQFSGALAFTYAARQVPQGIKDGFEFLRKDTPPGSYVLYPETKLLEFAHRPVIWSRVNLFRLFWGTERNQAIELLKANITYIGIKKSRIYQDNPDEKLHVGGYPQSFVARLRDADYASLVFKNNEMEIYKLDLSFLLKKYPQWKDFIDDWNRRKNT